MQPDISILIVTHNSAAQISACLDSLARHTDTACKIILVDNASSDETLEQVSALPSICLLANRENTGFAVAINQASRLAEGRYLYLLNPDTVINDAAIDRLVGFLDTHPNVGICAPRILDATGRIRHNCFGFETPWSFFWFGVGAGPLRSVRGWMLRHDTWNIAADKPQLVEAITGAAMLVRRELFEELNGLDERFFMYCEDGDLCWRAQRVGWQAMLVPDAVVTHIGGASTPDRSALLNGMIGQHLLQSRYRYTEKYWGRLAAWGLRLAYSMAGSIFWLVSFLLTPTQARARLQQHGRQLLMTPLPPRCRRQS